jgi:type III secretion protein N (ATPase)
VARQVTGEAVQGLANQTRDILSRLEDLQMFVDLGEYRPGENSANDHAMDCRDALTGWLRQPLNEGCPIQDGLEQLYAIVS